MNFCPDCGNKLAGPRKFCTTCKKVYATDQNILSSSPIQDSNRLKEWREGSAKKNYSYAKPLGTSETSKDSENGSFAKPIWLVIMFLSFFAIFLIPHTETCPTCGGDGVISSSYSGDYGSSTFESVCYTCGGSGQITYGFWYGLWFFWFFGFGFWWWIFFWPAR